MKSRCKSSVHWRLSIYTTNIMYFHQTKLLDWVKHFTLKKPSPLCSTPKPPTTHSHYQIIMNCIHDVAHQFRGSKFEREKSKVTIRTDTEERVESAQIKRLLLYHLFGLAVIRDTILGSGHTLSRRFTKTSQLVRMKRSSLTIRVVETVCSKYRS